MNDFFIDVWMGKTKTWITYMLWEHERQMQAFLFCKIMKAGKEIFKLCSGYTGPSSTLTSPPTGSSSGLLQVCTAVEYKTEIYLYISQYQACTVQTMTT